MLELTRDQILSHRRRISALDQRLPGSAASIRRAARGGLQDSMPRAALLSLHARVDGVRPDAWAEPPLVQIWGPRYSVFAVADDDVATFTLGRLPDTPKARRRVEETADRLEDALAGRRMDCRDVARELGLHPNALRYAAPTGRFLIRWDGARQPLISAVPPPDVDPVEARLELLRRYLHVFGPGTVEGFGQWAGVKPAPARAAFGALSAELVSVATPIGDGMILAADETSFRAAPEPAAGARLMPSGDTYFLLWGASRELLVPDPTLREHLWTSRVWPGAVLCHGEMVGTWRRSGHTVTVEPWQELSPAELASIEQEASSLPLPGLDRPPVCHFVSDTK